MVTLLLHLKYKYFNIQLFISDNTSEVYYRPHPRSRPVSNRCFETESRDQVLCGGQPGKH